MMSRYSRKDDFDTSYSPSSSPRGRRYILKNLNIKKQRQINLEKSRRYNTADNYYDITKSPPSQGSVHTNHSSKPIGTSNKVMPTDAPKGASPRKTPRETPRYVSPRKDVNAKSEQTKGENAKSVKDNKDTKKQNDANSPRKGKEKNAVVLSSRKNEKGLTPRDEYMVTKLYDREIIYLKPSEVRYTHDQITAHFSDGRSMLSTFVALLYGRIEIKLGGNDVPPIEVMQTSEFEDGRDGKIWYVVNGNRRLFVFRKLEKCGALTTMQVIARKYDSLEMDKHFLTRNKGRAVSITNDATLNAKLGKEVKRWKEWKVKQPKQKPTKGKGAKKATTNDKSSSCCCIS